MFAIKGLTVITSLEPRYATPLRPSLLQTFPEGNVQARLIPLKPAHLEGRRKGGSIGGLLVDLVACWVL